jgi:hypothetical protein
MAARFFNHAQIRQRAPFFDDMRHLVHFAAANRSQTRRDAAGKTQGEYAVSDDEVARLKAFFSQAVEFVSRQTSDYWHRLSSSRGVQSYYLDYPTSSGAA